MDQQVFEASSLDELKRVLHGQLMRGLGMHWVRSVRFWDRGSAQPLILRFEGHVPHSDHMSLQRFLARWLRRLRPLARMQCVYKPVANTAHTYAVVVQVIGGTGLEAAARPGKAAAKPGHAERQRRQLERQVKEAVRRLVENARAATPSNVIELQVLVDDAELLAQVDAMAGTAASFATERVRLYGGTAQRIRVKVGCCEGTRPLAGHDDEAVSARWGEPEDDDPPWQATLGPAAASVGTLPLPRATQTVCLTLRYGQEAYTWDLPAGTTLVLDQGALREPLSRVGAPLGLVPRPGSRTTAAAALELGEKALTVLSAGDAERYRSGTNTPLAVHEGLPYPVTLNLGPRHALLIADQQVSPASLELEAAR